MIICTEKVSPVTPGIFVKTVVDGQHQTMMSVIPNLLPVSFAMNAKANKKVIFVKSSCVSNNLIFGLMG